MKQFKIWVAALTTLTSLGFTSCMSETEYTPQGFGLAEVKSTLGVTFFQDLNDFTVQPTISSLEVIKNTMKFDVNRTRMSYIVYNYAKEGNETAEIDKKIKNAELQYAVSLDGTVQPVMDYGTSADSVTTAPIIALNNVFSTQDPAPFTIVKDRYLITGTEYFFNKQMHYFTLVYNEADQKEGVLKFKLRHSGKAEELNVITTSKHAFNSGIPQAYLKSFDIKQYLDEYKATGVKIEIEVLRNSTSNKLDHENTQPHTYEIDYKSKTDR